MAGNINSLQQLKQAETDIAVLQVRFNNLDEKINDLKEELGEMHMQMDKNSEKFQELVKNIQVENINAHQKMADKISALEKWRWMLMGAGVVIGGLGWETIGRLFTLG